MKKSYIIPIHVPYTNEWNFFAKQEKETLTPETVKKIIEYYFKNSKKEEADVEVYFSGDSFAGLEETLQKDILECIEPYQKEGKISGIRITTMPKEISRAKLKLWKKYKVKEISLQLFSMSVYLLEKIGIQESIKHIQKVAKKIRWNGFSLGVEMLIGMPEATKLDEQNTAKEILKLKPHFVTIEPVIVEKESKIEVEIQKQEYVALSIVQAVERCKEVAHIFNQNKVEEIKVLLPKTIEKENTIVAGPYHPEFTMLVEGAMWYDAILEKIKKMNTKVKEVEIEANPEDVPNMLGFKNENIEKLKDVYDVEVVITPNKEIKKGRFEMSMVKTYDDMVEEMQNTKNEK